MPDTDNLSNSLKSVETNIKNRKIKINGSIIDDFSYSVKDTDCVQYKGKNLNFVVEDYIYILNKQHALYRGSFSVSGE